MISPFALRYRTDPEFRARKLSLQAKYRATKDRRRRRLQYLHRRIFDLRRSLDLHEATAAECYRLLERAIQERARIQAQLGTQGRGAAN